MFRGRFLKEIKETDKMCIYLWRIGKFVHLRNSANLQKDEYMHNNQNSERQKLKEMWKQPERKWEHYTLLRAI